MEGIVYHLQSACGKLQSASIDGICFETSVERRPWRTLSAPGYQSFQLHRPANSGRARARYSRNFFCSERRERDDEDWSAGRRVFRYLHDQRPDSRFARRSILPVDYYRLCCDSVEPGQRRLRSRGNIRDSFCNSNLRWNWRRRLRTRGADNLVRPFPDRKAGSHHGDFLRGDSSRQRARLCDRWIDWRSPRLALGILSRCSAGFVAGHAVFLATGPARRCASASAEIAAPQHWRLSEIVPHALLSNQLRRDNIDDFCTGRFGLLGTGVSALSQSKS